MDKNGSCERFLHVCRLNPYKGRKKTLTPIEVLDLHRRKKDGEKLAALAREARVSRQTLYRYFDELEATSAPKEARRAAADGAAT